MDKKISRRSAFKFVTGGVVAGSLVSCAQSGTKQEANNEKTATELSSDPWSRTYDRVWLGGSYWANPMEDWAVKSGGIESVGRGGNRSVHSLTHELRDLSQPFFMSVRIQRVEKNPVDGGAGIRLGISSDLNEYRSNCFVHKGFDLGIKEDLLVLGDKSIALSTASADKEIQLLLNAKPQSGAVALHLSATLVDTGTVIAELDHLLPADQLRGNVALTSNFSLAETGSSEDKKDGPGCRYRFNQWQMQGQAFVVNDDRRFGPILWTMYSLSDNRNDEGFVLKLSAYVGPIGEQDSQELELQIKKLGKWQTVAKEKINTDGWLATFRVPQWDESQTWPFRVVYNEQHSDGSETPDTWLGSIKANPQGAQVKMAALTCQNDYGFPYEPVANNVVKLQPDLVFFSGDQIYESHGGYGIVRSPDERAMLNYLRKFYQFGWAFREAMRNQPTVCLPDDHDVLQGNLWGQGGQSMKNIENDPTASVLAGYIQSPRIVNMVHRTTLNHHPDAYDPTPTNGIGAYYCDMVYGNVSFAILADRQWKSAPETVGAIVGETGQDEDPTSFNPKLDRDGLSLLGQRQEDFLEQWGQDWRGHKLKAVLSQTVFAGISTHQPRPDRFLKYDFDSSGWPASARNRAIDIMRASKALHICGDTHLGTLSQYGVNQQRDSNWAFCTPAISAGWPRWWLPDQMNFPYQNRPEHGLAQTGEYKDTFGNLIYVYAVGNPEVGKSGNRYIKAHEKGSGFGFITFDTEKLSYTMQAYRFLIDATDGSASNQFPGWPVTIYQAENGGDNQLS
ncbi:alkaline phosphatase D family protein [Agaribacterium sp. ZY112]|uniref:alkaline phosphatase D family protein n=1 Tax=Agaribacterium sp. ZY112 TaxID=3233574 RepID=UPI0035242B36